MGRKPSKFTEVIFARVQEQSKKFFEGWRRSKSFTASKALDYLITEEKNRERRRQQKLP